jgi:hypothetical protein
MQWAIGDNAEPIVSTEKRLEWLDETLVQPMRQGEIERGARQVEATLTARCDGTTEAERPSSQRIRRDGQGNDGRPTMRDDDRGYGAR